MSEAPFRVIIVGGSVAGLTLAHCLNHLGIDYVLLEKRQEIAPQEGASIGIMPNGGRILDQLGLYDRIEDLVEPLETAHALYPSGFTFASRYPKLLRERFGFPLAFLDRQKFLEILHTSLLSDDRIRTNRKVTGIRHREHGILVEISDGSSYEGDIVVGADGVHSIVRGEMWRLSNSQGCGQELRVEYACIFGISSATKGLKAGQQISCYNDDWSILSVTGKHGRTFWFLFVKLDTTYSYGTAPKFSQQDAIFQCEKRAKAPFWGTVTFGDIWRNREVFNMTPLEEGMFRHWHWGRIFCIGDSMHKIAPHLGQGANCAIEDAACLSNELHKHDQAKRTAKPSTDELSNMFQHITLERVCRLSPMDKTARFAMRLQARSGILNRLLGRLFLPYAGDRLADWASADIADSLTLDFLPPSKRSGPGWGVFKPGRSPMAPGYVPCIVVVFGVILAAMYHLCQG